MALKLLVPMTTLVTANEQSGVVPLVITSTGTSREYPELGAFSKAIFTLDISAVAGTNPTLDVTIQGLDILSGKWRIVVTFPQQTTTSAASPLANNSTLFQSANLDYQVYRAAWTLGGTASPSFTTTINCIAHTEEPSV